MDDKCQQLEEEPENPPANPHLAVQTNDTGATMREWLWNQIDASFDTGVTAPHWRCRSSGLFHQLWSQMCGCVRAKVRDLSDLFQGLPKQWQHQDTTQRLISLYHDVLCPLMREHFTEEQQRVLMRSLKHLVVLRLLDVPYRYGDPVDANPNATRLLHELHQLCQGNGLMVWRENGAEVFVIETEQALYVNWVIHRMAARMQRKHRDKTLSDALWATLFSHPDHSDGVKRCLRSVSTNEDTLCVSGEHFPDRDGVIITTLWSKAQVLIFESPWEADRGHRVRRAIQQLPGGTTSEYVWIWEPRTFTQAESQTVLYYIAAGQALRCAILEYTQDRGLAWVINALRRAYISACPLAMKTLLTCFDEGLVVSDGGVYSPVPGEGHLLPTLEAFAGWIQPVEPEMYAIRYRVADNSQYPDILPLSTHSYGSTRSLNSLLGLSQKMPIL